MKTHGDDGWRDFPSYLDVVVPKVLEILERRRWKITFFVVGQDAALDGSHPNGIPRTERRHPEDQEATQREGQRRESGEKTQAAG